MKEKVELISSYHKALEWIKNNTLREKGIAVSSKKPYPYLEVTGYMIPTLLDASQEALAYQYARFLNYMQRPNGSFAGTDGREYIFDTGQVLRGLNRAALKWEEFKPAAHRCAKYIVSAMKPSGQIPSIYEGDIPESIHVYVLPALLEAAHVLNEPSYQEAAYRSLRYYQQSHEVLNKQLLTHFWAYIVDGFIDMGETAFVKESVQEIFEQQKPSGSISAYPDVSWVCLVGVAQLGIIAHKLEMSQQADLALGYMINNQNPSGGFWGSLGMSAKYFPKEEIAWANKFFLDLMHLRKSKALSMPSPAGQLSPEQWHKAMAGEPLEHIALRLKRNSFVPWCQPLLEKTSPGDSVLEIGSGTGELAAILSLYGREVHLLDFSPQSIEFSRNLFNKMGLKGQSYMMDVRQGMPLGDSSVDWVFSSGVLEHFTDEEIVFILTKSREVSRKGVMSLVPNSRSLFYRIGKQAQEDKGTWPYGLEVPKQSMRDYFKAAGLVNIQEYSICTYHSLEFWGKSHPEIRRYLDTLSPMELQDLNQGYLLFTYGEKNA